MSGPGKAQRAARHKGLPRRLAGWGEGGGHWQEGGALPQPGSSVQPPARSRAPRHPGGTGGAARSSGAHVGMAPAPGQGSSRVLCGAGRGEVKAEGTLQAGRWLSQRACSPPPFPRTGLASLGYKRGAGTMGVLCLGEALKDPRLKSYSWGRPCFSSPGAGHGPPGVSQRGIVPGDSETCGKFPRDPPEPWTMQGP